MSIIVVEADPGNEYSLVVLESETGNEIQRIPSPSNEFLQYPVWSEDGGRIFVTSLSERGKRIKEYDLNMRRWKTVFQSGFDDITELNVSGNYLLFRGTFSGIDNIYVLELKTGQCYQVTSSRYGAFHPCLSTNCSRLIYSNYTSQGFDVVEMDFIKALWKPLEEVRDHSEQLNAASLPDDKSVPEVGLMEEKHYTPEPFSKTLNLFNLHSWSPFYFNYQDPDIENPDISAGITLLSQNKLSTATTIVGYEYKEKEHYLHASFLYTGWFPAVSVGYDYGGSPFVAVTPENVNPIESVKKDINLRMKVYLPLNLTTNRYVSGAKPAIEGNYNRSYYYYNNNPSGYKSGMTFMDYRLYFYHYLKISHRDILPRWGQVFDIRYIDTPFEKEQIGSQVTVLGTLYFPGILRHHVIKVKGGYQKQEPEKYLMRNRISMPRGYSSETMLRMKKMSLDYVLPILYPDLRVWRIAYFKRIRADLFYDLALGYDVYVPSDDRYDLVDKNYYSLGFELTTDFHLMHIFFPFNSGIRFIYLPEKKKSTAEFVFSVDLNRF